MNTEMFLNLVIQNDINCSKDNVAFVDSDDITGNKSKIWHFKDNNDNNWVIKQYPEWVKETDIKWIHKYMKELSKKGFPLINITNRHLSFENHIYSIYSHADGTHYDPKNKAHLISMASELSHLHSLSRDIKIEGDRNWPTVTGFVYEGDNKLLSQSWDIASKLLKLDDNIVMPIHGDFRQDNIRFNGNGVSKVFDFGNARNDYPEVDLAITLRGIASDVSEPSDYLQTQRKFLLIYRDLNKELPKISPQMICASAIILSIQENSYLLKESLGNDDQTLKLAVEKETSRLNFLLDNLVTHLSFYQDIFK